MYMPSKKHLHSQAFQEYAALFPVDKVQRVDLDVFANTIKNEENIKKLMPEDVFIVYPNCLPQRVNSHNLFNAAKKCNTTITFDNALKDEIKSLAFGHAWQSVICPTYDVHFYGSSIDDLIMHALVHLRYYEHVLMNHHKTSFIIQFPENINRDVIKDKLYPILGAEFRSKMFRYTQGVCVERPIRELTTAKL